jgi:hypothetical protein
MHQTGGRTKASTFWWRSSCQSNSGHWKPCGAKVRDISFKPYCIGAKLGLGPSGNGEIPADGQKLLRRLFRQLRNPVLRA